MTNNERSEPGTNAALPPDAVGRISGATAVFAVGIGPWLWPARGGGWQVLLVTAACAEIAALPFLSLYRFHIMRRWRAALDAYAAQEIERDRRWKTRADTSASGRPGPRKEALRTRR
jgi:hypothetical protein